MRWHNRLMPDSVRDSQNHAQRFEQVRAAHQLEVAEDYVEMIADLINTHGEARAVDLAECFGVTNATVNNTVSRLQRDGLVESQPYRSIFLTEKGKQMAEKSRDRHQIVIDFLKAIGVSEKTAQIDAEGVEHHVSEETLRAFKRVIRSNNN